MTLIEEYEAQPYDVRDLIESYTMNLRWAGDCFDTLLSICPEKECSIRALAEAYAEWHHQKEQAEEQLKELGYDDNAILKLSTGYYEKYYG